MGIQVGKAEGIQIGEANGAKNKAIAIAKKMLEQKSDLNFISLVTGLDKSVILSLRKS